MKYTASAKRFLLETFTKPELDLIDKYWRKQMDYESRKTRYRTSIMDITVVDGKVPTYVPSGNTVMAYPKVVSYRKDGTVNCYRDVYGNDYLYDTRWLIDQICQSLFMYSGLMPMDDVWAWNSIFLKIRSSFKDVSFEQHRISLLYKHRNDEKALEEVVSSCLEIIKMAAKKTVRDGRRTLHQRDAFWAYERLIIIYDKRGDYARAIDLCKDAIGKFYVANRDNFRDRIYRYECRIAKKSPYKVRHRKGPMPEAERERRWNQKAEYMKDTCGDDVDLRCKVCKTQTCDHAKHTLNTTELVWRRWLASHQDSEEPFWGKRFFVNTFLCNACYKAERKLEKQKAAWNAAAVDVVLSTKA
jgi:hypothetical protein